jgi:hypothetical protein
MLLESASYSPFSSFTKLFLVVMSTLKFIYSLYRSLVFLFLLFVASSLMNVTWMQLINLLSGVSDKSTPECVPHMEGLLPLIVPPNILC